MLFKIESLSTRKEVEEEVVYSTGEEMKGLSVASAMLERLGLLNGELRKRFRGCQRLLRLEKVISLTQTAISDHFRTV